MPRYFFDLLESDNWQMDQVGLDLPDEPAARESAMRAAVDILRDNLPSGDRHVTVRVRDPDHPLFDVDADLSIKGAV